MSRRIVTQKRKRKSKIELAGDTVVQHLIEMAKNTDLSLQSMANKLNDTYHDLKVNKMDVSRFFKNNETCLQELAKEKSALSLLRANIFLEPNEVMVKHIKKLDTEIDRVTGEAGKHLDVDKRATTVANLIDKAGQLLLRHARLNGKLDERSTNINKMQVNQQVNVFKEGGMDEEIMQRLKQFNPHKTEIIPKKVDTVKKKEKVIDAEVVEEEEMILEEVS